jgi:hypothetical protein
MATPRTETVLDELLRNVIVLDALVVPNTSELTLAVTPPPEGVVVAGGGAGVVGGVVVAGDEPPPATLSVTVPAPEATVTVAVFAPTAEGM